MHKTAHHNEELSIPNGNKSKLRNSSLNAYWHEYPQIPLCNWALDHPIETIIVCEKSLSLVAFLNALYYNQMLIVDPGFNLKNITKK